MISMTNICMMMGLLLEVQEEPLRQIIMQRQVKATYRKSVDMHQELLNLSQILEPKFNLSPQFMR